MNGPGGGAPRGGETDHSSPGILPFQIAVVNGEGKGSGLMISIPVIGELVMVRIAGAAGI